MEDYKHYLGFRQSKVEDNPPRMMLFVHSWRIISTFLAFYPSEAEDNPR